MQDERSYTITLTQRQLDVVAAGLDELPGKFSRPVTFELMAQVAKQDQQHVQAQEQARLEEARRLVSQAGRVQESSHFPELSDVLNKA